MLTVGRYLWRPDYSLDDRMNIKIFTTDIRLVQWDWAIYKNNLRGSGYCDDCGTRQAIKRYYYLFGLNVWTTSLDFEECDTNIFIGRAFGAQYMPGKKYVTRLEMKWEKMNGRSVDNLYCE